MKHLKRFLIVIGIILIAIIIFNTATYVTMENEYSIVKQFGEIVNVRDAAGLNVKIPFIQSVNKVPKSKQLYDIPKSEVITSDKKTMIIDAYVIWRVTDARLFTSSLNASTSTAEGRIDVIVYNSIKTTISSMTQDEVIASRDQAINVANTDTEPDDLEINDIVEENNGGVNVIRISKRLLDHIGDQCDQYGIRIEDVKIKILDLPDENKSAVYERMITERNNIAAAYTAQGKSEAQKIKNTTDREVTVMLSEAQADADRIVAEGEAEYMSILSDAYNDPEKADFYLFTLSLDAVRNSFKEGDTTLFIDKDSPIAQIFEGVSPEKTTKKED